MASLGTHAAEHAAMAHHVWPTFTPDHSLKQIDSLLCRKVRLPPQLQDHSCSRQ
jgi:hypothetical protein